MATFKCCVYSGHLRQDGTNQIKLRVLHGSLQRRIKTNIRIAPEDVTKGLQIKNPQIKKQCADLELKCVEFCNSLNFEVDNMSIDELVTRLKSFLKGGERFRLNFIPYIVKCAEGYTPGTRSLYKTASNTLARFAGRNTVDISEITPTFLRKFEAFIQAEPSQRGANRKDPSEYREQPKGGRAASHYLTMVRAAHNRARSEFNDEENGIVRIPGTPFKSYSVPASFPPRKRAISRETFQKFINCTPPNEARAKMAKDCLLLSFALVGMNSADLFHAPAASPDGTVTYRRHKTESRRTDGAEICVQIDPKFTHLFERYRDPSGKRLFCFYMWYLNMASFNRALNMGLDVLSESIGVDKITFYTARHTWATCAAAPEEEGGAGIDMYSIASALNHSEARSRLRATECYVVRSWGTIWNTHAKVMALFDWSKVELEGLL